MKHNFAFIVGSLLLLGGGGIALASGSLSNTSAPPAPTASASEVGTRSSEGVAPEEVVWENPEIDLSGLYGISLKLTFTPDDSAIDINKEIKWTVTPSDVAEITEENGQYTIWGRKFGEATITGIAANDQVLTGTVTVNGIKMEPLWESQFFVGDTKTISLTSYPEELGENVVWISSAPDVVSVSDDGTITCLSPGRARITARNEYNGKRYDSDTDVTVYPEQGEVAFANKDEWLNINSGNHLYLPVLTNPDDNRVEGSWQIADTNIVTFESEPQGTDCVLVQMNVGTTEVTFTANGKTATCQIHVYKEIESITPIVAKNPLTVGDTCQIELSVVPENSNNIFIYKSKDENVATVDSNGLITAVGVGSTFIECGPKAGGRSKEFRVNVVTYPESITVANAEDFNLNIGATRLIDVKFTPEENVNRTVKWTVDNPEIAEIVASENEWDKNKYVKGLAYGKTIVRGETPNGLTTEFEVNVYGQYDWGGENSFELNASDKSINIGETFQIKIEGDDKGQTFTYSSEDESIATVDSLGLVTAGSYGETNIKVVPMPQGWPERNLRVKVRQTLENVELGQTDYLFVNSYSTYLDISFTPDNYEVNREITWSYDPEGVVNLYYLQDSRKYLIIPVKLGQTTVTGVASNGQEVKFTARYEGLQIDNRSEYDHVNAGDEFDLAVSVSSPEIRENIKWSAANPDIISVDNGHVTCHKPGKSLIYVNAIYDGKNYQDQIDMYSHPEAGQIALSLPSLVLPVGDRKWIQSIMPKGENNDNGIWSIAEDGIINFYNERIGEGELEAISPGTTTLTYTLPDGRSASMEVTVVARVEDFSLVFNGDGLTPGKTSQIEVADIQPSEASKQMVYTSENEEIATVDANGLVTAVGLGEVIIRVKPQYQDWPTRSLRVHVKEAPESVELTNPNITFKGIGSKNYLNIVYTPDNENIDKTIKWSYSKDGIINIDKYSWSNDYYVDSKDFGTVTFTGEAASGQIIEGTATVNGIAVEGNNTVYLNPGESHKFDLKASSAEILNSTTWGSYNTAIVEVDNNGKATAIQPGSTEIYVNSHDETDSYFTTKTVIVYPEEGSVALTSPSLEMLVGSAWNYLGVVLPEGDDNYSGVWAVSDESIIRFNEQYGSALYFETIATGTATITYTMEDGRSASCEVKVRGNEIVDYISLNSTLEYGKIGETFQMEATAYPEDFGKTIQYYSDNNEVATVDAEGLVTYVGYGTAIVSANLDNCVAQLTVNVYEEPVSATIEEGDEITVDTPQDLTPISIAFEAPEGVESDDICTDIVWEYSENGIDYSENGIIKIQKKLDQTTRARVRVLGTRAADDNAKTADFAIEALDFGTVEYKGYSPYDTEKTNPLVTGKVTIRGILLDNTYITCYIDEEATLNVRTSDEDVESSMMVDAEDDDIAKVVSNDKGTYTIQGLELGETWFNATSEVNGVTYSASAYIYVMENPAISGKYESLSLDSREVALYTVDTKQLAATVLNGYGNEVESPSITWSSSNPTVATVSPDGTITPKDYGSTTITAAATDTFGNTLTATCEVNVIKFSSGGSGGSGSGSDDPSGVDALFGDEGTCDIYNVNGEVLKQNATKADFDALDKGIYIIRKDNKAVKVVK